MKKIIITALVVPTIIFTQSAFAATDYLLKLEGVDGESTKSSTAPSPATVSAPVAMPIRADDTEAVACTMDAKQCPDGTYVGRSGPKCEFVCPTSTTAGKVTPPPAPPRPAPTPSGDPDFDLLKVAPPSPTSSTGSGKVNIAVGDVNGDGTSAKGKDGSHKDEIEILSADGSSESATNFGVLLGGGVDVDRDGVEDLVYSPPTEAQAIYIKLGDVKGESMEGAAAPTTEGKEIRKNITINLRAKELRDADEKTRAEILLSAPTSTDAVRTGDDLALFILRDATENPAIDIVDIVEDKIVIQHEARGKFLGLFTMSYSERIEVGSEGDVEVRLPWYSFLVNEDLDEEEIALAAKEKKKEKPMQIESWSFGASQAGMYAAVSGKIKASWNLKENVK